MSSFGSKCELEDALLKKIAACGVVDLVTSFAKSKEERGLKKGDGAKRSRLVGAGPFLAGSWFYAGVLHQHSCCCCWFAWFAFQVLTLC